MLIINSGRWLSFLKTNHRISFLISSWSEMSLCTWHNATLFRRIWPQVDRVNDFNLRRLLKLLSAVAEEAGFTRSNLTSAWTVGNVARMASTSVLITDSYLLVKKLYSPLFQMWGTKKFFSLAITFFPPTFKTLAAPLHLIVVVAQ